MPTRHDPPRASAGEKTQGGRVARRPGPPAGKRKDNIAERMKRVADLMGAGRSRSELATILTAEWSCSARTVRAYRDRVLAERVLDPEVERMLGAERLEDLYARAVKAGDHRTAMHIARTRMLVAGVIGPRQHEHRHRYDGPPIPVVTVTLAEAAAAARAEVARRLAARIAGPSREDAGEGP